MWTENLTQDQLRWMKTKKYKPNKSSWYSLRFKIKSRLQKPPEIMNLVILIVRITLNNLSKKNIKHEKKSIILIIIRILFEI